MTARPSTGRELRKWPFPFDGALAISNDAEFMSMEFFETLMRFLRTREPTPFGDGLGIDVTSSFFAFTAHPYNFSLFAGSEASAVRAPQAERVVEAIRRGWIDTIHAYGDFDQVGGFCRGHAERYLEEMDRLGLTVPVFTNHGSIDNIQNVGCDASYHRGDVHGDAAYHVDLWPKLGIRHVWTDSMIYAKEGIVSRGTWSIRSRLREVANVWLRRGSRTPQAYFAGEAGQRQGPVLLQDGHRVNGFRRFRSTGANAPNLSSLGLQLQQVDWDDFYARGSIMVVYQHLGVLDRKDGRCSAATVDAVRADPERYLNPFRFLAAESEQGRLWLVGAARLLDFERAQRELVIHEDPCGVVQLVPRSGDALPNGIATIAGLTLYEDHPISRVLVGNTAVATRRNGPDRTGRRSVSILHE